jgi:adenine C2-methylase RlmN of 23S rRNA A2503 and tRNA A37|tara:strand:+ start:1483 stop:1869 length:387 start_codon:yes stop_codon:yes gene_type:complete
MIVKIPVSVGELVDKITILEIKNKKIKDIKKLSNIKLELKLLNEFFRKKKLNTKLIKKLKNYLYNVNLKLWNVEDKLRDHEYKNKFNQNFVKLARKVYFLNDKRSKIKKDINESVGSKIIEEKSYKEY